MVLYKRCNRVHCWLLGSLWIVSAKEFLEVLMENISKIIEVMPKIASRKAKDRTEEIKHQYHQSILVQSVYKAALTTGQIVAVKRLNMSNSSDIPASNRKSSKNVIHVLTKVKHRNIIRLYGFCSIKGFMYLVYENVEKGSLGNVLYGLKGKAELDWGRRVKIVQGVAHAIAYLYHDCFP
ncbi:MDIS1-interacting receptor like kinase 2-like [Alnus glutinosa]|uniref:MDIS1-interacting receptor like kinase 2-like n=1 Tax=Alnus glutinosa TaxID=3517 RepID=UPI002D76616B|nr:MDIS1-interacting receptor like kinase 2-like [Alnus glutinosa]